MSLSEVMIKKSLKVSYTRKELEKTNLVPRFVVQIFATHINAEKKKKRSLSLTI